MPIGDSRRGAGCQTNPISLFAGLRTGVPMENEANLGAGGRPLGIRGRRGVGCQTNPISPRQIKGAARFESLAHSQRPSSRPLALALPPVRQTNPISPFSGLKTGVPMENEANLGAGGRPLGIWDCGLGICDRGGVEHRRVKCQTKPISPFLVLKTGARIGRSGLMVVDTLEFELTSVESFRRILYHRRQ